MQKLFFEMSFEDFCTDRGLYIVTDFEAEQDPRAHERREYSLACWREDANKRFAAIKASSHWHGGVPCADVHDRLGNVRGGQLSTQEVR